MDSQGSLHVYHFLARVFTDPRGRVTSGQEVFEVSRVASGRVRSFSNLTGGVRSPHPTREKMWHFLCFIGTLWVDPAHRKPDLSPDRDPHYHAAVVPASDWHRIGALYGLPYKQGRHF